MFHLGIVGEWIWGLISSFWKINCLVHSLKETPDNTHYKSQLLLLKREWTREECWTWEMLAKRHPVHIVYIFKKLSKIIQTYFDGKLILPTFLIPESLILFKKTGESGKTFSFNGSFCLFSLSTNQVLMWPSLLFSLPFFSPSLCHFPISFYVGGLLLFLYCLNQENASDRPAPTNSSQQKPKRQRRRHGELSRLQRQDGRGCGGGVVQELQCALKE